MSFKKGDFYIGKEQEFVPLGTKYVAHSAGEGWVRLVRGEPVRRIPRVAGQPFPARAELGDTDKALWPRFDNEPNNPWVLSKELLLTEQATGRPVIFKTGTFTGREAVAALCRFITYQRRARCDNAKPIIELGCGTWQSKRGPIAIPKFTIIGWDGAETVGLGTLVHDVSEYLQAKSTIPADATSTNPLPKPRRRKAEPPPPPWEDNLTDQIPI